MAVLEPLSCVRPKVELAAQIATGPHSFFSKEELRRKVADHPITYTRIAHPRSVYGDVPDVYRRAAEAFREWMAQGVFQADPDPCYYLYRLESEHHAQSGLVGRTPVQEILEGRVHAHETIRESKLQDLTEHIEECGIQVGGPILMAFRSRPDISAWMRAKEQEKPLYDFVSENGLRNCIWRIEQGEEQEKLREMMREAGDLYIADGHHRVMAGVELCRRRRAGQPDYSGQEPWNYLAAVCFPEEELRILPYSRIVDGLNGLTGEELLNACREDFMVQASREAVVPSCKGEFGMLLEGSWYRLTLREGRRPDDPQRGLDVAVLQDRLLGPVLGIADPRTCERLDFAGGESQLAELVRRCSHPRMAGFIPCPVSMGELFAVADAEETMPPKSTWFEPKLCNGLFLYRYE